MHTSTLVALVGAIAAADAFGIPHFTFPFGQKHPAPYPGFPGFPQIPKPTQPQPPVSTQPPNTPSNAPSNADGNSDADDGPNHGPLTGMPGQCPSVWTSVVSDMQAHFLANGQCNELARQAVRASFHDCGSYTPDLGTGAGCDGSFILAEEFKRNENRGMDQIAAYYQGLLQRFQGQIGAADLIQMGGATATVVCPLGPTVQIFVGRPDRNTPNPEGILPSPFDGVDKTIPLFAGYGLSVDDLVALVGSHSVAKQQFVDPSRAGQSLDKTPGVWDVKFYGETVHKTAPFMFQSDLSLANSSQSADTFKHFVNNQEDWNEDFASAMTRLSLVGVPGGASKLIDCTSVLPRGSSVADKRSAPMFARRAYHQRKN